MPIRPMSKRSGSTAVSYTHLDVYKRQPQLKATDLTGDYRILADFGDAVLAGHPTERGVQFVTWEWRCV